MVLPQPKHCSIHLVRRREKENCMKVTTQEVTEALLEFCRARSYPAPPLQMESLERCLVALQRDDIRVACRHAKEVIVGVRPWFESFDHMDPEPLEHESQAYVKAVFRGLLYLWQLRMNELEPPVCNACQRPKSLSWHCERVQHR